MTDVRSALRQAASVFQQAGIATPAVDARLLMAYALETDPMQLFLHSDRQAPEEFSALVARRVRREPLQHITGQAFFYGLPMLSEPGAFIPRPETELLVEWAEQWIRRTGARRILDLCTGPGTIALALASIDLSDAEPLDLTAVDIDPVAVRLAEKNKRHLQGQGFIYGQVEFVQADVADAALVQNMKWQDSFDLVISNPPYVPEGPVDPEVEADPHHAVFSGADGMDLIPHVVSVARDALRSAGGVGIEHDDTTSEQVQDVLAEGFTDITAHRDLADRPRFVTASKL